MNDSAARIYVGSLHVADLAYTGHQYSFTYTSAYLANPNAQAITGGFPLRPEPYTSDSLFPYFENLAPEGIMADAAAAYFGIEPTDKFHALLGLGRDLAGHIRIESDAYPPPLQLDIPAAALTTPYQTRRCLGNYSPISTGHYSNSVCDSYGIQPDEYLPIRQSQLTDLLKASAQANLSLAGFQPKISGGLILRADLSHAAYLHSAIIKLPHPAHEKKHVLANEHLTTLLAKTFGIDANDSILMPMADGQLALIIRRFDREPTGTRFRCEDFCQILGHPSESKYSTPTESLPGVLRTHSGDAAIDQQRLFDQLLFSLYVGNADAHLKNFSILFRDTLPRLSPAYDLVATKLVTRDPEDMALSINGKKTNLGSTHIWHLAEVFEQDTKYVIARATELAKRTPDFLSLVELSHLGDGVKRNYKEYLAKSVRRYNLDTFAQHAPQEHVHETRYADGTLESRTQMRGKKIHGLYESFYPDGRPHESAHYQYGYRHGETRTWLPTGALERTQNYAYGLPIAKPQTVEQPAASRSRTKSK